MTLIVKKLLLISITLLFGVMSGGASAEAPIYNATVLGTNYNFTYSTYAYADNTALLQSQPWWGSSSLALTFAAAVGPAFTTDSGQMWYAYSASSPSPNEMNAVVYDGSRALNLQGAFGVSDGADYVTATIAAPEIDGALIPQVGLLLAGLFLILGRRKESTEPMLAV